MSGTSTLRRRLWSRCELQLSPHFLWIAVDLEIGDLHVHAQLLSHAWLWPLGLQPQKLLCLCDFSSKNTGVDCYFLLQDLFDSGIEPASTVRHANSLSLSHLRSPIIPILVLKHYYSPFKNPKGEQLFKTLRP